MTQQIIETTVNTNRPALQLAANVTAFSAAAVALDTYFDGGGQLSALFRSISEGVLPSDLRMILPLTVSTMVGSFARVATKVIAGQKEPINLETLFVVPTAVLGATLMATDQGSNLAILLTISPIIMAATGAVTDIVGIARQATSPNIGEPKVK